MNKPSLRRLGLTFGVIAVLLLVFTAYLSPHMALDLATRLWACF